MKLKNNIACSYIVLFMIMLTAVITGGWDAEKQKTTKIWKFKSLSKIGGVQPQILGNPVVKEGASGNAISFNGENDGLIVPLNPVQGWPEFTVQVLFKPALDGHTEPRFVHFEDSTGNRGTIELRITPAGNWYLDTFLYNSAADSGLTLRDSTIQHPAGEWYWAALTYDGQMMRHYVNGQKELEGAIDFDTMNEGRISVGVRLNHVHWFKGLIKEIHFSPEAVPAGDLIQP